MPTLYVYNADTGACTEVLELGTLLPTTSRLLSPLSAMGSGAKQRFNALGKRLAGDIGALRGSQGPAEWTKTDFLPAADQLCLEGVHVLADRALVALLPGQGAESQGLQLYTAQHLSWERQVAPLLHSTAFAVAYVVLCTGLLLGV